MTLLNIVLKFGDIPLGRFCCSFQFFFKRKFDLEVTFLFKGQKKFTKKIPQEIFINVPNNEIWFR